MNQIRTKYQLPTCAKIPGIQFDLDKLKAEVVRLEAEWVNLFQANRGLCSNHQELAENNYQHFHQINLTYFEPTFNTLMELDDLRAECKLIAKSDALGDTKMQKFRTKINRLPNLVPAMNEHNWFHPLKIYEGSYIQQAIESQFKAKAVRVRLTRIQPGKELTPHIDYGPEYAVRIIVPIMGAEEVTNLFWNRGKLEEYNLKADGSAYFLNIGHRHAVKNDGTEDRICLMFSLAGQDDIQDL
jgi:quercetin dioxygenase-like cupin family protein